MAAVLELLREGVDFTGPVGPRVATVPKLASPVDAAADDAALLAQVRDYYHRTLKASPEALAYLETRGLKHEAVIDGFRLGFANRTLGLRLPDANRLAGEKVRARLQALGVLRDSGHEHLNGSLVVPLHDEAGAVVGLYGRKVTPKLRVGTPNHLYLPGPHRAAFNSAALAGQQAAIVCEALLDALSFWVAGHRNVTSAYGVEGFTPHHLEALKRHGVRDVLIAYDRDDAGDAAAEALGRQLEAEGFDCYRVQFPRGMDANEYALKVQPAAKSLGVALRHAAFMGNGAPRGTPDFSSLAASPTAAVPGALEEGKRVAVTVSAKATTAVASAPAVPGALDTSRATPAVVPSSSARGDPPESGLTPVDVEPQRPAAPRTPEVVAEVTEEEALFHFGPRRYRVRGLAKALSAESLKVNVLVSVGEAFHVDTLDMYAARQRAAFLRAASDELRLPEDTLKRDMGALLLKLEALQEATLKDKLAPKKTAPTLGEDEREAALALLRHPRLLDMVVDDFERCGVVGEETNKLVGYLAAVSRKLDEPLAVLIQSSSAAGKSSLMEAVLAFVPEEDKTKFSAMTGQSLFYMGDADLKHKVLAVVEEEGAARAAYALKLLQSEGELTIASTGKDPASGKLVTHEYRVEGPTQLFLTTTASELDEELLNRCLVLTVDEERAQTKAIHEKQKEKQTLEGLLAKRDRDAVLKRHQNAQRLLRPLAVVNPYARHLTFLDDRTRARRDFPKYLTLIRTIALLHQHQRPVKTVQHEGAVVEYVEVQLEDIATANRLAHAVLGRSLDDLPPQTRRLLTQLDEWVTNGCRLTGVARGEYRFTRRQVREALSLGDTQLKVHLGRLLEMEYLRLWRGRDGGFEYQLLYEGQGHDGARFLVGLVDVDALCHAYDSSRSALEASQSGASRPPVGGQSAPGRGGADDETARPLLHLAAVGASDGGNARQGLNAETASYG
ncbi:MAG: toprim domain-containing protein [Myxococcales bacterium]|nr:toprim domain-containing protein [Myxococcales bacterium]